MMVFTLHQLFNSSPTLILYRTVPNFIAFSGIRKYPISSQVKIFIYILRDAVVRLKCTKTTKIPKCFCISWKIMFGAYVLIFNLRRILTYLYLELSFEIRVFQHPRNIHKNCHASCSPQKMSFKTRLKS